MGPPHECGGNVQLHGIQILCLIHASMGPPQEAAKAESIATTNERQYLLQWGRR